MNVWMHVLLLLLPIHPNFGYFSSSSLRTLSEQKKSRVVSRIDKQPIKSNLSQMRLPLLLRQPQLRVARASGRAYRQGHLRLARQFHDDNDDLARSSSASAPHPAFVWHNNATDDDYHRISEDLSYFPCLLSDTQQRILLNAALDRLDRTGSYASRRKRLRLLKSTDTETDVDSSLRRNVDVGNFLPDEYYDFEQVSFTPYRPSFLTPYLLRTISIESLSSFARPASPQSSGLTKKMSSPSSPKSPLCSHQYPSRHMFYISPPMATFSPTSIISKRAVHSSLASV